MNPMSEKEFQDFLLQANWFMRARMEENQKEFQLDGYKRFDWDPWRGELIFSSGGVPKVVARIQIVGSQSAKMSAWSWGWANPALPASVRQAALKAKEFGTERGVTRLLQPKWSANDWDAWGMTAVAAKLNEAKGAYRCPTPDGFTYMIFSDIRAVSDRKRVFGAMTCCHVLDGAKPILLVSKEPNGDVLAVCGGEEDSLASTKSLPLTRLLDMDPSLAPLADLPDGWMALRDSPDHDWARSKAE